MMTPDQIILPIYLDYQATTPIDPRVSAIILQMFEENYGNPHSVQNSYGKRANHALEEARQKIAHSLGCNAREIIFTSGSTEANNLAIKGAAYANADKRRKLVTLASEHKSVLESFRRLEREGYPIQILPVGRDGLVDLDLLEQVIDEDTLLVSVMAANNETGVVQPLEDIGRLCKNRGALLHCDAAQGFGKIPLDLDSMGIDLLSLSSHKIYGPAGIGALYVRRKPRVRLTPLFDGGGQERDMRSGTVPLFIAVAFAEAMFLARDEMHVEAMRLSWLRGMLLGELQRYYSKIKVNGSFTHRLPGNLNIMIPGVDALRLINAVPEIAFSTGSACSAAEVSPSYVLAAMGLSDDEARSCVRLSLGRFTQEQDIKRAGRILGVAIIELCSGYKQQISSVIS